MNWQCTKCPWLGPYKECDHVMYRGTDWEHCPSCKSLAIPALGSREIKEARVARFDGMTKMMNPVVIREFKIPVYVTDFGSFVGEIGEEDWVEAPTFRELKTKLDLLVQQRSKDISIPFAVWTLRAGFRTGTIRGFHASHGDFLVTWDDGIKDKVSRSTDFVELPSPEVQARMVQLVKEIEVLHAEGKKIHEGLTKFDGKVMAERVTQALSQK